MLAASAFLLSRRSSIPDSVYKTAHFVGIFKAGRALDPTGDIDGKRTNGANRLSNIIGRQAAREDHRHARIESCQQLPRCPFAGAAILACCMTIEQDGRGHGPHSAAAFQKSINKGKTIEVLNSECRHITPRRVRRRKLRIITMPLNGFYGQLPR
jgi:hypothetical protein